MWEFTNQNKDIKYLISPDLLKNQSFEQVDSTDTEPSQDSTYSDRSSFLERSTLDDLSRFVALSVRDAIIHSENGSFDSNNIRVAFRNVLNKEGVTGAEAEGFINQFINDISPSILYASSVVSNPNSTFNMRSKAFEDTYIESTTNAFNIAHYDITYISLSESLAKAFNHEINIMTKPGSHYNVIKDKLDEKQENTDFKNNQDFEGSDDSVKETPIEKEKSSPIYQVEKNVVLGADNPNLEGNQEPFIEEFEVSSSDSGGSLGETNFDRFSSELATTLRHSVLSVSDGSFDTGPVRESFRNILKTVGITGEAADSFVDRFINDISGDVIQTYNTIINPYSNAEARVEVFKNLHNVASTSSTSIANEIGNRILSESLAESFNQADIYITERAAHNQYIFETDSVTDSGNSTFTSSSTTSTSTSNNTISSYETVSENGSIELAAPPNDNPGPSHDYSKSVPFSENETSSIDSSKSTSSIVNLTNKEPPAKSLPIFEKEPDASNVNSNIAPNVFNVGVEELIAGGSSAASGLVPFATSVVILGAGGTVKKVFESASEESATVINDNKSSSSKINSSTEIKYLDFDEMLDERLKLCAIPISNFNNHSNDPIDALNHRLFFLDDIIIWYCLRSIDISFSNSRVQSSYVMFNQSIAEMSKDVKQKLREFDNISLNILRNEIYKKKSFDVRKHFALVVKQFKEDIEILELSIQNNENISWESIEKSLNNFYKKSLKIVPDLVDILNQKYFKKLVLQCSIEKKSNNETSKISKRSVNFANISNDTFTKENEVLTNSESTTTKEKTSSSHSFFKDWNNFSPALREACTSNFYSAISIQKPIKCVEEHPFFTFLTCPLLFPIYGIKKLFLEDQKEKPEINETEIEEWEAKNQYDTSEDEDLLSYATDEVRSYVDEGQSIASSSQSIDLNQKDQQIQPQSYQERVAMLYELNNLDSVTIHTTNPIIPNSTEDFGELQMLV